MGHGQPGRAIGIHSGNDRNCVSTFGASFHTRALPVINHTQHLVLNPSNRPLNTHQLSRQTEDTAAFLSLCFFFPLPPLPNCPIASLAVEPESQQRVWFFVQDTDIMTEPENFDDELFADLYVPRRGILLQG